MKEILKFSELGSEAQQRFFAHARLLIEKEYVDDKTSLDALAEKVYDSYIKNRIETSGAAPTERSFLSYDKEKISDDISQKPKDDNWLK